MFNTDFSYPLENNINSIKENYLDNRLILKDWFSEFYVNFDEKDVSIFTKMKKLKFLGGYIDFDNAQNINCRSLCKHLNKKIHNLHNVSF